MSKLSDGECVAALRAFGMTENEIGALVNLTHNDAAVQGWFTMWRVGHRTLPQMMVELVLMLAREKEELRQRAIRTAENATVPIVAMLVKP